jgi:hypothetical protein
VAVTRPIRTKEIVQDRARSAAVEAKLVASNAAGERVDHAAARFGSALVDEGHLIGKNPASRTKFPPMRHTSHFYMTAADVAALARICGAQGDVALILAYTGLRYW